MSCPPTILHSPLHYNSVLSPGVVARFDRRHCSFIGSVWVAFNEELMFFIWQPRAHHFEAPGWNLLRDMVYVNQ